MWCGRRSLKETERDDAAHGLLSKFLDDMMPARLSWQFPREKDYFWVFWSEETTSHSYLHRYVQDRIKTALSGFKYPYSGEVLIQFWAAPERLTTSDPKRLTTSDLFAISCLTDEKLIHYKKDCPINKIVADDHNGLISRVFNATVALPLYAPSGPLFVGVLELLFTVYTGVALDRSVYEIERRLQGAGLKTVNPMDWIRRIREVHFVLVEEELKGAMCQVFKTHGLPLACVWARQSAGRSVQANRGLVLMQIYDLNGRFDDDYNHISFYLPFTVDQVPDRNWFHSDKPCFFRDVAQLSIIEYPMAHFARMSGFTSCFVVCLQSIANENCDYVLEFFLPRDNRHSGDLHIFLSSMMMILKQHLKSFEVVTGDIRNDLLTQVDNLTESNVESSMVKEKNVKSSMEFTYTDYMTISSTEAEDSAQSLHTESMLISTTRKPDI